MATSETRNHKGHEVSRRIALRCFLRVPSWPWWLTVSRIDPLPDAPGAFEALFVSQSLDRIQPRRSQGRNHAANQSHSAENQRGGDQRSRSDDQADVAGFPILGKGAVQSQSPHGKRDRVGQYHSPHTADKGDGEGLSEELGKDVPALRTQRLLHANFASALRNRNQHDIHESDAAKAECKRE